MLRRDPGNFEACDTLAVILSRSGRVSEAAQWFKQALTLDPNDAITQSNYGNVLEALGRREDAIKHYDRALAIQPGFADAILNRAAALCALGRPAEALESLDTLLQTQPRNFFALYNRSVALAGLERYEEAVTACDATLGVNPSSAEAWHNRGVALSMLKRFAEAVESYDRSLRLNPNVAQLHINRGSALATLARYPEAVTAFDQALALDPNSAYAWFNRGVMLSEMKRIDDAIASYEAALRLVPDYAQADYNRALCLMQLGRLEEGYQGYEARRRLSPDPAPYPQPIWSGEAGKVLLVRGEQGLGDIIQFSRYIRLLRDRDTRLILMVPPPMVRLLNSLDPTAEIIAWTETPPPFDCHIPLESLPGLFHTRLDTIPASIPYLAAEPALVEKWKDRLGAGGFKIGIAWRSSAAGTAIGKTFSPAQFAPLANIPGVRLISLQKDDENGELNDLPSGLAVERLGPDFDAGPDAFVDSAAVMQSLDLIISSDTGIAHLAGALGRPTWVALKYVPDWRWMLDRTDTQWYPTMRLFRQAAPGDWASVFAQIEAAMPGVAPRPFL